MTRNWLVLRIQSPPEEDPDRCAADAMSTVVPTLVNHFRQMDPGGRWFADCLDLRRRGLVLRFHTTAEAGTELVRGLGEVGERQQVLVEQGETPTSASTVLDRATLLSCTSSDLAVDLHRAGAASEDTWLPSTILHLSRLVDLVTAAHRKSFLFSCWEQWARRLPGTQRVALSLRARDQSDAILREVAGRPLPAPLDSVWRRYHLAVRDIIAQPAANDGTPVNYLLFDHAHRTHRRLGVPATVESFVALVLLMGMRNGIADVLSGPQLDVVVGTPRRPSAYALS